MWVLKSLESPKDWLTGSVSSDEEALSCCRRSYVTWCYQLQHSEASQCTSIWLMSAWADQCQEMSFFYYIHEGSLESSESLEWNKLDVNQSRGIGIHTAFIRSREIGSTSLNSWLKIRKTLSESKYWTMHSFSPVKALESIPMEIFMYFWKTFSYQESCHCAVRLISLYGERELFTQQEAVTPPLSPLTPRYLSVSQHNQS